MKNILHVVNIYFVVPYFLGEQLIYFSNRGYSEHIICSPSLELKKYSETHFFQYREIPILRTISFLRDIYSILSICRYIKQSKIDIITGHTPKGALLSMIAGFCMYVPIRIYFRHGLVYETATGLKRRILIWMDRLAAFLATKIVCVSPSVCQRSIEDKLNRPEKQILLSKGTCNGIDVNKFNRENIDLDVLSSLRIKLSIPTDCIVIGFTGRLVIDKGIIELINAFSITQKKHSKIALLLVGMLEGRDALPDDIVSIICTNENIINTGYVDNEIIEYYYALMDIFVLPSYREGFPTSVLEASSMQLPIITTRVTGCIDAIIENKTGVFVHHDANEISDAIMLLLSNEEKRKSFGIAGRKFVTENFDQCIIWAEIEKLYL